MLLIFKNTRNEKRETIVIIIWEFKNVNNNKFETIIWILRIALRTMIIIVIVTKNINLPKKC